MLTIACLTKYVNEESARKEMQSNFFSTESLTSHWNFRNEFIDTKNTKPKEIYSNSFLNIVQNHWVDQCSQHL